VPPPPPPQPERTVTTTELAARTRHLMLTMVSYIPPIGEPGSGVFW
jgi:hypothetical protein